MAFTADALSLVTVESRPAVATGGAAEYTLKFWDVRASDAEAASAASTTFTVNTAINDPHLGAVTALAAHPEVAEVVTAGVGRAQSSGEFRRWLRQRQSQGGADSFVEGDWHCTNVGSYKGTVPAWDVGPSMVPARVEVKE
jgi:hypothetical protein